MKKYIPYLAIGILLILLIIQNKGCQKSIVLSKIKIDTVISYIHVHDTILGKSKLVYKKIDTSIWIKKKELKPSENCDSLKKQYISLGNSYFLTNFYKTDFKIKDYGTISILDSLRENKIVYSEAITNLIIPEKIITKEITLPPKKQLFIGTTFTGNPTTIINSVSLGLLLKNKKDQIYGVGVGYNGEIIYSGSLYYPIKFK